MSKLPTEITRENVDRVIAMLVGEYFFGQCIEAEAVLYNAKTVFKCDFKATNGGRNTI